MPAYPRTPLQTEKMPPGIPYIIGNEAAERFSFYGMRTVLTIYMVNYLWLMGDAPGDRMSDAAATETFHLFVTAVYFTPILGALLADILIGKFGIIMMLSIVYCFGHGALALMGMAGEAGTWLVAGLWLIAIGSGGIKPCVSAHVGDQFGSRNRPLIPRIFNWFYWSINLGAFLSTLFTPWLMEWYGPHWAFGVPGILMALATLIFWMGRWKFVHIRPKGMQFVRDILSGEGLRAMFKLAAIYVFVAVFWALFDQTGSSWVLQAKNMDRHWLGIEWLPSQIQALNPILILTFIPLFSYLVYPAIHRVFPLTPLRKIAIGFFIMVIAFALVSVAQEKIDAGGTPSISWQLLGYVFLTGSEVMVSIVCLEFSYTQAPRSMKSLIMSLFLLAVAAGNLLTAGINHLIQVPDPTAGLTSPSQEVVLEGPDGRSGTKDDVAANFDEDGRRTGLDFAGKAGLHRLLDELSERIEANDFTVPSTGEGGEILSSATDPWGRPYRYRLVNRERVTVWSPGPDGEPKTRWDHGATLTVNRPEGEGESGTSPVARFLRPERPWLERRKDELGVGEAGTADAGGTAGPSIERRYFVGGQVRLQGASYFWFFTGLMLAAALLFVVVAMFYRPHEYFHEEEDDAEAREEAVGN